MRFNALTFVMAGFTLAASFAVAQADQTLTGTVTDAMCGKKQMMQGASAAKCTRECAKSGSDYALAVEDRIYILKGDKAMIDKFAGANVVVKGKTIDRPSTVDTEPNSEPA